MPVTFENVNTCSINKAHAILMPTYSQHLDKAYRFTSRIVPQATIIKKHESVITLAQLNNSQLTET